MGSGICLTVQGGTMTPGYHRGTTIPPGRVHSWHAGGAAQTLGLLRGRIKVRRGEAKAPS